MRIQQIFLLNSLSQSRNEDWYRYGADVSKSNIQFIDINLSKEEARSIYEELQKKGKLKISDSWQSFGKKCKKRDC